MIYQINGTRLRAHSDFRFWISRIDIAYRRRNPDPIVKLDWESGGLGFIGIENMQHVIEATHDDFKRAIAVNVAD